MDRVYVILCDTKYDDEYKMDATTEVCFDAGFFTDKQDCLDAAEKMAKEKLSKYNDSSLFSASFGFVPERDEFYVDVFFKALDEFAKRVSFRYECIEAHKKEV